MQTTTNLKQLAIRETYKWIDEANSLFDLNIPHIPIEFTLRGTTAGKAWCCGSNRKIQYHPVLLAQNTDGFIRRTIPHEVAHIVVHAMYPYTRVRPHGNEWKFVMRAFGVETTRCHKYDVSEVRQSRQKLDKVFEYRCCCKTYRFTIIRHRRCLKGVKYSCPKCKGILNPV